MMRQLSIPSFHEEFGCQFHLLFQDWLFPSRTLSLDRVHLSVLFRYSVSRLLPRQSLAVNFRREQPSSSLVFNRRSKTLLIDFMLSWLLPSETLSLSFARLLPGVPLILVSLQFGLILRLNRKFPRKTLGFSAGRLFECGALSQYLFLIFRYNRFYCGLFPR